MNTAIIPARNVRNVWAAFHGLPAAGYPVKAAAVVIELWNYAHEWDEDGKLAGLEAEYRVTSGQPLTIAG